MKTRQIAFLRPKEIVAEQKINPIIYLPIGPIEWHGPHMPVGTDPLHASYIAEKAADLTGGLVWPTAWWGTERERSSQVLNDLGLSESEYIVGMDFPANSLKSGYVPEDVFAYLIRSQLEIFIQMNFKIAVLVSGHGATNQLDTLQRLAAEYNGTGRLKTLVELPFVLGDDGLMHVGHASCIETSIMEALYPETVEIDSLPPLPKPIYNTDWAIVDYHTFAGKPAPDRTVHHDDDPRSGSAEIGFENMRIAIENLTRRVSELRKM